jgi:GDP-L-fucose synthase
MNKNSKIYIAGHLGLVGSAIWKNLQSKGYTNLVGKTIDELDLMNQQAVADFYAKENPEYVILAAAKVGGIIANNTYRADFIYENLMIQNNVIYQSFLNNVKKLLFLGSTCIYPREAVQPMHEECLLTGPLEYTNEPYAIAKIAGLKMCENFNLQYGTNYIAVMPTNLYGYNDNFNLETSHVLPALIRKIYLGKCMEENNWEAIRHDIYKNNIEGVTGTAGKKEIMDKLNKYGLREIQYNQYQVEIWGTGKPLREFLWSEEMADACIFIMEKVNYKDLIREPAYLTGRQNSDVEVRNLHINIGTGKEISIFDLAHTVKKIIGFQGELFFNASKPDGTMRKLTDPSKLHSLGWHHKIEIEEGIEKLFNWYKKENN